MIKCLIKAPEMRKYIYCDRYGQRRNPELCALKCKWVKKCKDYEEEVNGRR